MHCLRVLRNGKSESAPKPTIFSRHYPVQYMYFPVSLIEENPSLDAKMALDVCWVASFPVPAGCALKTYFSASTEWISNVETTYFHQRTVLLRVEVNELYM